jgi:hypothetical protein
MYEWRVLPHRFGRVPDLTVSRWLLMRVLVDLRTVTLDSLRRHIGVVPQETTLFNDTIFYNIQYGNPSATREQVIQAAKMARIHESIMRMPEQYESKVGERGLKLSGQKPTATSEIAWPASTSIGCGSLIPLHVGRLLLCLQAARSSAFRLLVCC